MCVTNIGYTFIFVFFVCVNSSPIIIRTGLVKNQGQHQDENMYNAAHQKGIANFEEDEGFNKDNQRNHVINANSGHFGEENGIKKDHLDQNNFNKEQFYQNGGGGISDIGNKVAHKKGHHKSGFQNSYHKDEQGSNSSFFDDAEDEADQYTHRTQKGTYGNLGQGRHHGGNLDNSHYANEGGKRGMYDASGEYEKDLGNRQNRHRNNFYDSREEAGRRNAANDYGEANRYQEERYSDRPHGPHSQHYLAPPYHKPDMPYHKPDMPYHKPAMQKKRITIYEDPRYTRRAPHHEHEPRYADDFIELDVRPGAGYYPRRPPRDYYY